MQVAAYGQIVDFDEAFNQPIRALAMGQSSERSALLNQSGTPPLQQLSLPFNSAARGQSLAPQTDGMHGLVGVVTLHASTLHDSRAENSARHCVLDVLLPGRLRMRACQTALNR